MTTVERHAEARHTVGPAGAVFIRSIAARVIVRGVDGDEARVELRHGAHTPDLAAVRIEEAFAAGTHRSEGRLEVSSGEGRRFWADAGPFGMIARAFGIGLDEGMEIVADVPRGADVHVETVSGPVVASGVAGRMSCRTVSGEVRISGAGEVSVETTSGDAQVDADAAVALDWHSMSGSLRASSPLFRALRLDTMSGAMAVAGPLAIDGAHNARSVSGTLRIEAHGGLTIETQMLSGSVRSEVEHRLEGRPGAFVVVAGDGSARLRFETMSGDLALLAPSGAVAPGPGSGPSAPDAPAEEPAGRAPRSGSGTGEPPRNVDVDRLAILRAVERGEIDVDDALRQLREASDA